MQIAPVDKAEFFAATILLPAFAVVILSGLEWLVEPKGWRERLSKLGWDTCVLAVGILGGMFANPDISKTFSSTGWVTIYQMGSVLLCIGVAIVIAFLRRVTPPAVITGRRALICLALGGATLFLPVYFASRIK